MPNKMFAAFLFLLPLVQTLKCWNCVGEDCDKKGGPSWTIQECPEGSFCQTVTFEIYSRKVNKSLMSKEIRSCTYQLGCRQEQPIASCRSDVTSYGTGCPVRKCCATDLCNDR